MIPYGRQSISENDIAAVVEVLRSDFLTQGPVVEQFEARVLSATTANYAVAMNSATSALHVACLALGLGPGDWLWTSPITFVASANCALYCGASVDFVDIDPRTYNMCPLRLAEKLALAKQQNCLPKVIVPVHLAGQSCDMQAIHQLAQQYGCKVIEDASHAIGASYLDQPVGNCRFSDITVFSFHPVKIITTAEGGLATTNDAELATRMAEFRTHGITRDPKRMTKIPDGPWYYQQIALGLNYRMTELQAALGCSQMNRLSEFVDNRQAIAARYNDALTDLPLLMPEQLAGTYSSYHLYIIRLQADKSPIGHKELFELLRQRGIGVNLHYIPVHLQPYYLDLGFKENMFPNAEQYYKEAISIPVYHGMTGEQQEQVIGVLHELLSK